MKDPVLFFRTATAHHLTSLIQCLHCPLEGRGSCECLFPLLGGCLPWEVSPSC